MSAELRPKPLLTVAEAGRELGISTRTAYEWLRRGELPGAAKHGGHWYVRRAVLLAYLNGADVLPAAEAGPVPRRPDIPRPDGQAPVEER